MFTNAPRVGQRWKTKNDLARNCEECAKMNLTLGGKLSMLLDGVNSF